MALALLACIFFRPFLLCFLAKHMFLRNLGSTPLRDSYRSDRGFLMPFLCCFRDWLCMLWFLDLARSAPGPAHKCFLSAYLVHSTVLSLGVISVTRVDGLYPQGTLNWGGGGWTYQIIINV